MTNGLKWGEVFRMYSGAEETFQKLYNGEEVVGSVIGYDYDGDCGYLARRQNQTTIGKYKRREDAQKAVEKYAKKILKNA